MIRFLAIGFLAIGPVAELVAGTAIAASPESLQQQVRTYRQTHEQQIIDDFVDLLAIPNVASDSANIRRNADHLSALLAHRGFETRLLQVGQSPPAVFGERRQPGADKTLLIYVHYDGQPVQPENWSSPPWQPTLRDGPVDRGGKIIDRRAPFDPEARLYARSAGDDKAPVIALMYALDALAAAGQKSSVNLKVFFEGEEEAGSPHLREVLEKYKTLLGADLWLFCDGPVHQTRRWQLAYGVRGTTGFQMTVYGPARPLHSGHYGNWAPNPISALVDLLASMRDQHGRVLVDGFYDQVREPTERELSAIRAAPKVDEQLMEELQIGRTEHPETRLEQALLKPAMNFRGIRSGGVGDQSRNIISPAAEASVGLRLVPDQSPAQLREQIEAHIRNQGYHIVYEEPDEPTRRRHPRLIRLHWEAGGYPSLRTPMDHPLAEKLSGILNRLSGGTLVEQPTMGGSLPLFHISEVLAVPVLILPIANHDNNQHGRDENIRLQNLWDAIEIYAVVLRDIGR